MKTNFTVLSDGSHSGLLVGGDLGRATPSASVAPASWPPTIPRDARQCGLSLLFLAASLFAGSVAFADNLAVTPAPDDPACTAEDRKFMARAFEWARKSLARGDNAIGAVLVKDGRIVCESGNSIYTDRDLTQHGETGLISHASPVLEKSLWEGSTLYTSLEPCIMCCGSMHAAGIKTVVYGGTSRQADGSLFGPQRLRVREIYRRYGWNMEVRGPLMDEEQLKIRAETAARNAKNAKTKG